MCSFPADRSEEGDLDVKIYGQSLRTGALLNVGKTRVREDNYVVSSRLKLRDKQQVLTFLSLILEDMLSSFQAESVSCF